MLKNADNVSKRTIEQVILIIIFTGSMINEKKNHGRFPDRFNAWSYTKTGGNYSIKTGTVHICCQNSVVPKAFLTNKHKVF